MAQDSVRARPIIKDALILPEASRLAGGGVHGLAGGKTHAETGKGAGQQGQGGGDSNQSGIHVSYPPFYIFRR